MELIFFVFIVYVLFKAAAGSSTKRGRDRAVVKGHAGEAKVISALKSALPSNEYFLINDIVLSDSLGETQIDHVLISRFGVFVIETKNYSGWIFGNEANRTWTQTFYKTKFTFQNPLRQNYRHVKAVQHHLGIPENWIHSVVLFVGKAKFKTKMPENVTTLRGGLQYIRSFSTPLMSETKAAQLKHSILNREQRKTGQKGAPAPGLSLAYNAQASGEFSKRWASEFDAAPEHTAENKDSSRWFSKLFIAAIVIGATVAILIQESAKVRSTQAAHRTKPSGVSLAVREPAPAGLQQDPSETRPNGVSPPIQQAADAEEQPKPELEQPQTPSFELFGRIVKVTSGDTAHLKVKNRKIYRIKLHGIDAPEYNEAYGRKARRALSRLIYRKAAYIDLVESGNDGFAHGVVYVAGKDINLEMVCSGHARWNEQEAPANDEMKACQGQAQAMALGLWTDDD